VENLEAGLRDPRPLPKPARSCLAASHAPDGGRTAPPSSRTHAPAWGPAPAWRTSRGKGHRSRIDLREPVTSGRAARGSAAGAPVR
jgi:hypothetical protein